MSKDRHIFIRLFNGDVVPARCRYCSHMVRQIKGERVHYLGMCNQKIAGVYMDINTSVGVNNYACDKFDPQPSVKVVQDNIQTSLFT